MLKVKLSLIKDNVIVKSVEESLMNYEIDSFDSELMGWLEEHCSIY